MEEPVTDIWFRTSLPLERIVAHLGLSEVEFDAENVWEWAIGTRAGIRLDVTREHSHRRSSVDTRIFRLDNEPFTPEQVDDLVDRIRRFVPGTIFWGRGVYLNGNDFNLQVAGRTGPPV